MDTKRTAPRGRPAKSRPDGKRGRRGAGASEPRDVRFFRTQAQWRAWLGRHHRGTAPRGGGFLGVAARRPRLTARPRRGPRRVWGSRSGAPRPPAPPPPARGGGGALFFGGGGGGGGGAPPG